MVVANDDKADFKVIETRQEDGKLVLSVEVEKDVVSQAFRTVHKQLLKHVHVPGFRPGKIPLPVISNAVGRENFTKEVRKELLPRFYYAALETTDRRPVDRVEYVVETLAHGQSFIFTARVLVAPDVKLPDYHKLKLEIEGEDEVDDKAVEKTLLRLQQDHAESSKAEDDVVADGDFALISFTGSVGGKEFKTLSQENMSVVVGNDDFVAGFDSNLVGKKKGEEFTFPITMPKKGTENEFLVGKKVMFKGKVKSVYRQTLPELDDDFAKKFGEFENLDALKEKISRDLEKRRESKMDTAKRGAIRKALAAAVEVTVPEELVRGRLDDRLEEFKGGLKDLTFEEYLEEFGKDEETVSGELREKVVDDIRADFALDFVAAAESLAVTDEELEDRIVAMARMLQKDPEEILEALDESGQRLLQKQDMLREKAFDSVMETYK